MKRTNKKSELADPVNVRTIRVNVNLEHKTAAGYKHAHDELIFNLAEESVAQILEQIKPVLERADLHSAFIALDSDTITQEEWDSYGDSRGFDFTRKAES